MPQPTQSQQHVDAPLSNVSLAYIQGATGFVAGRVFPNIPVTKQSDSYFVYTKADWFRDEAERRGDSSESAGSGYGLTTANYNCDVFALHKDIGDQVKSNADLPLNPEQDAARFIAQRMMLRREIQWQSDFFASGVWGTDLTPSPKWSVPGTSDPITDIETGKQTVLENTGFMPNTLVLGYTVFRHLKHHPDLVDRFKHTTPETLTESLLAAIFGIDRVLVAMAVKNTGDEGGDATYDFVQSQHDALLCYVPPTPGPLTPAAGYTFTWTGVSDGLGIEVGTSSFNIRRLGRSHTRVESEIAFDHKVVGSDLGYFFSAATS